MRSKAAAFRGAVRSYYKKEGRHALPWRKTTDPYRILVSESMLQQTQVDRVVPKYRSFLRRFPSVRSLAAAPLSAVLKEWQGLGYNRRAKMLHAAARAVVASGGAFPQSYEGLIALPGVGPYTASAVRTFAFNQPEVFIETNIRAAYLHHFFPARRRVPDAALLPHIEATLDRKNPREWYSALMDYGSYLKRTVPNPSRKSAHHVRQKPFKGSDREIRGAILRALARGEPLAELSFPAPRIRKQLAVLVKEGLIEARGKRYSLAD